MKAIVIAGGLGTRLWPYTKVLPKPLLPIDDMPMIEVLLRQLKAAGIDTVTLALHYKAALFRVLLGDGSRLGLEITYSESGERLGTAGPIALIEKPTASTIVLNGDILCDLDFRALARHHVRSGAPATIVLVPRNVEIPFGVIETDDDGVVTAFREKPTLPTLINGGIYVVEPEAWEKVGNLGYVDVSDLIRRALISRRGLQTYVHRGCWMDIGTVDAYHEAQTVFRSQRARFLRTNALYDDVSEEHVVSSVALLTGAR